MHYKDFYTLSQYFNIPKFTSELDNISRNELFNDLNFTIQILLDSISAYDEFENNLTIKIENFLADRVNECIKNAKFGELPVSTIYRIIDKSNKESINQSLLFDFIMKSISTRFTLFKFVEIQELADEKVEEFFKFINELNNKSNEIYLQYISFNISFIVQLKNKYDDAVKKMNQIDKEYNQTKQEFDQTKQELNQTKQEFDQTKQEFDQTKQEFDQTKQEFDQTKQELNQIKQELNQTKQELNQTKQEFDQTKQEFNQTKQELAHIKDCQEKK